MSDASVLVLIVVMLAAGIVIGVAVVRSLAKGNHRYPPLVPGASGSYSVDGRPVRCTQCDGESFHARQALLNTWLMSLLRFDWLDSSAAVLSCQRCGALNWFSQRVEKPRRDTAP